MANDKNCKDCFYFKKLHSGEERCCHYIFIEDKMRPCDPGAACTVKIKGKYGRRKKRG